MLQEPYFCHTERTQLTIRDQFFDESGTGDWYSLDDIFSGFVRAFELSQDSNVPFYQEALVIDEAFFSFPQTGPEWDRDDAGYNFKWTAPSRLFREGGTEYRIQVTLIVKSSSLVESWTPVVRTYRVYARGLG